MGSVISKAVVDYAAQECEWQRSGEMSVAWFVDAWAHAHRNQRRPIKLHHVVTLGRLVEPHRNRGGLRMVGVRVGWDIKMKPELVPAALDTLLANQPVVGASHAEATEWFRCYEVIHPFVDGNGRTGTLLFNWLRGTLVRPVHVPNLWNDPRRN